MKAALRRRLFARVHKNIGPELQLLASGGSRFDPKVAQDLNELGYSIIWTFVWIAVGYLLVTLTLSALFNALEKHFGVLR